MIATNKEMGLILQVASDLDRHEGFREFAYPDPLSRLAKRYPANKWGYLPAGEILAKLGIKYEDAVTMGAPWTVGYGFTQAVNPDSRVSKMVARRKLEEITHGIHHDLARTLTWYRESSFETKTVLINMYFNLGKTGLFSFRNTLKYIAARSYRQAAVNMLKSLWSKQVGVRARELARRMETQEIPEQYRIADRL